MKTRVYTHKSGYQHDTPDGHPESPARLDAAARAIASVDGLEAAEPRKATREELDRVHTRAHLRYIFESAPATGQIALDADTWMSPGSLDAALYACGAAIEGVDWVMSEEEGAAFVACRPPGHHAEPGRAMGFCLFNQIAVAAAHAYAVHELQTVAVVDFDVHHGNGTQAYAEEEERLYFFSIHQGWIYPGTGGSQDRSERIVNVPVERGTGSKDWREQLEAEILGPLEALAPDLILVSAGFDGHGDDPLAGLALTADDYAWIGTRLGEIARDSAHARLVCTLEGGYDMNALEKSLAGFLRAIAGA